MPTIRRNLTAAVAVPNPPAGAYVYPHSPLAVGTSATLGIGALRVTPWLLRTSVSLTRIGAEVTVVGDAGSKLRLGIYGDTGNAYPGNLVVDAGQIAGDSATVQELTIAVTIRPGLYWIGGVVQTVTTTQPTVRTQSGGNLDVLLSPGTTLPSAGSTVAGYNQTSVTGALPATFTATVAPIASAPRLFVKLG